MAQEAGREARPDEGDTDDGHDDGDHRLDPDRAVGQDEREDPRDERPDPQEDRVERRGVELGQKQPNPQYQPDDVDHFGFSVGPSLPAASVAARFITAVSIGAVNRPVNVFCWLGWNDATRWYGPISTSDPWPKRGLGRGVG